MDNWTPSPLRPPTPALHSPRRSRLRAVLAVLAVPALLAGAGGAAAAPLADPAVLPGTFVGGTAEAQGRDVTVAPGGDLILVGNTAATDLPVTDASTHAGYHDVFVARFDAKVRTLKWLVYLGGSGEDTAAAVAVDGEGDVYVTGATDSTDFPTTGAYDASANGAGDAFVAKLAAGDGDLEWSTYLGGNLIDAAADIAVDGEGRAIVVGSTRSHDFPTVSAFDSFYYSYDAFITRFAANGASLELSTYYSTVMGDTAVAVDVDGGDDIYVAIVGSDPEWFYQENYIFKIDESSKTVTWSFLVDSLGTSGMGLAGLADLAVSDEGEVAFAGLIDEYQTSVPMVDPLQAANGGGTDFFVGKLNGAGNAIAWSTYLGGAGYEYTVSLALTGDGKVWVAGLGSSADYPLREAIFPAGAGVASLLSADGQQLLFSTRIGGNGLAELDGIAIGDGAPWLAGTAYDPPELPLTGLLPPAIRPLYSFWNEAFLAQLEPVASGRFLPRRSQSLPPLDRVIEPYPWGALDLDSDGRSETYLELADRSLDLAWGQGVVLDRAGDGRQVISVAIGTLGGARVVGSLDQDGDGEVELVVEDPRLDAGTVQGWLLDTGDQDVDLVVVGRGGAPGAILADLDGDGEQEVVVAAPHLADGAVARLGLDLPADADTDVLFIGGLPRAVFDFDGDGELEVIAERAGTPGTVSAGSVEAVGDLDDDVIFVAGEYAFARDLDGDGLPEVAVNDGAATAGTFTASGRVIFVGGAAQTTADLDGDGEQEVVVYDPAAAEGTFDPQDSSLDGSDGDPDVVFAGGAFRGAVDLDGDHEAEILVEDGGGAADTVDAYTGLEAGPGGDPDLVVVRGAAIAAVDTDDDGELEVVADSGTLSAGALLDLDGFEDVPDGDPDVVFLGGSLAAFADLDGDWDFELLAENAGASAGTFTELDGVEATPDGDADVVFFSGAWRAVRDLDHDGEPEVLAEDASLGSAASVADGVESSPDLDADLVFVAAPLAFLGDFDGDGEPEIVAQDSGLTAPAVSFSSFADGDADTDLLSIPPTAGWRVADLDGDAELELVIERSGGTPAAVDPADGIESLGDGDPDVVFVGGLPQLVADLDGDAELEVVAAAAITAGTASVYRTSEGLGDGDPDVVFAGGTARGYYDADGDWEYEVVVENGSGGASSRLDGIDAISDTDADLIFTGGRVRLFADVDYDGELEAIAEDSAATPGTASRWNGADGDGDADLVYLAGVVQGQLDLDGDGEFEVAATDASLAGGTGIDPAGWDGDGDADGVLAGTAVSSGSPSLTLVAPNGGGSVSLGNGLAITWSAAVCAASVRIELSRDGGSTWETLFGSTDNDGSETWASGGAATATALIRVTSRNLATPVGDDSDATFSLI